MIRVFLLLCMALWLIDAARAQDPSMPQAMPGPGGANPPPQTAPQPQPTTGTDHGMLAMEESESVAAADCCPTRLGLLRRLFGGWNHGYPIGAVPHGCSGGVCPSNGNWCPIITTYDYRRARKHHEGVEVCHGPRCRVRGLILAIAGGCRERGAGLGLCCRQHRAHPLFSRIRAWLAGGRVPGVPHSCMPNPYQAPLRYYFQNGVEHELYCNQHAVAGSCVTPHGSIGTDAAAGVNSLSYAAWPERYGIGLGGGGLGGVELGGGGLGGSGLMGRLGPHRHGSRHGMLGCRSREQCPGLAGSHFEGEFRFARDEKPAAPPINTGQTQYESSQPYNSFMRDQGAVAPTIQPVSHHAPKR